MFFSFTRGFINCSWVQLYKKIYTSLSFGAWPGIIIGPNWRLSRSDSSFFPVACFVLDICDLLVSGFDIIYALQDEEFDRSQKLYSIPAWLGKTKALKVSELLHVFSAACIIGAGLLAHFGWLYWVGVLIFCGMLIYQHSIVKPTDLKRVNLAFMTANGIASVVFACFVIADLFVHYFSYS